MPTAAGCARRGLPRDGPREPTLGSHAFRTVCTTPDTRRDWCGRAQGAGARVSLTAQFADLARASPALLGLTKPKMVESSTAQHRPLQRPRRRRATALLCSLETSSQERPSLSEPAEAPPSRNPWVWEPAPTRLPTCVVGSPSQLVARLHCEGDYCTYNTRPPLDAAAPSQPSDLRRVHAAGGYLRLRARRLPLAGPARATRAAIKQAPQGRRPPPPPVSLARSVHGSCGLTGSYYKASSARPRRREQLAASILRLPACPSRRSTTSPRIRPTPWT